MGRVIFSLFNLADIGKSAGLLEREGDSASIRGGSLGLLREGRVWGRVEVHWSWLDGCFLLSDHVNFTAFKAKELSLDVLRDFFNWCSLRGLILLYSLLQSLIDLLLILERWLSHGLVLLVADLVIEPSWDLTSAWLSTALSVGLAEHILSLDSWDVTAVTYIPIVKHQSYSKRESGSLAYLGYGDWWAPWATVRRHQPHSWVLHWSHRGTEECTQCSRAGA